MPFSRSESIKGYVAARASATMTLPLAAAAIYGTALVNSSAATADA